MSPENRNEGVRQEDMLMICVAARFGVLRTNNTFVLGIIDKNKGDSRATSILVNSLGRIDGQKQENGCELCGRGKPIRLRAEESACWNDADGPVILAQEPLHKIN
nr:hypothetical protein Iba_chr11cCG8400 [Ipomoea batatas]